MTMDEILGTVSLEDAKRNCPWSGTENAIRTSKKEVIGNRLIKKNLIMARFYGERAIRVTDRDEQLKGVDFKTSKRNIDVKVSIGDFRDDNIRYFECVPIEIYQDQKITFTEDKATTDVLFVNVNLNTDEVHFLSVPYSVIVKIVKLNLSSDILNRMNRLYIPDKKTSKNGSGIFIKMPVCRLVDFPGVYYSKQKLNKETM